MRVDLHALIAGRAEDQNVVLQAEDVLYVPGPKVKWTQRLTESLQPFYLLRQALLLFTDPFGR